jgi:hypothetical protein
MQVKSARALSCGQPFHQLVHFVNRLGDRGAVLFAPAADLSVKVIAGLAEMFQTLGFVVYRMQSGDDTVHFKVDVAALLTRHVGQCLVPKHPSLNKFHDIKSAANDGFVLAQHVHVCHRHRCATQAAHDGEFTFNGVSRRQQFGHRTRLGTHDITFAGCDQFVSGVGLAAFEHFYLQRAFETWHVGTQPGLQSCHIKTV